MEVPIFKVLTRNIASSRRTERIIDVLKTEKPDLLLLQEVTLSTAELSAALHNLPYQSEANIDPDSPSTPGTAALWRVNLPGPQVTTLVSCQLQEIKIGPQSFLNVYAPSGSQGKRARAELFTQEIFPHLLQQQVEGLLPVLAGDWNCVLKEKDTTANFRDKYSKDLDQIIKALKYSDSFRMLHPDSKEFTFHRSSCAPARLDRVYLPPHLSAKLQSASHQPGLADHWGVCAELLMDVTRLQCPHPNPKTHWKLNCTILDDHSFLPQFSTLFNQFQEAIEDYDDIADWWDFYAKPACVNFCKSFSVSLARQKKVFKKFLRALLRHATSKGNWSVVSETKEKLNKIIKQEVHGLVERSRDKQNSEEELASIFHFRQVQKRGLEKLKVSEDGRIGFKKNMATVITSDAGRIEAETVAFTDSLLNGRQDQYLQDTGHAFQPDYSDLEEFLDTLSQLSQDSQQALVAPLSEDEVKDVVKSCANGKSPGLDGLTYEFFKRTWHVIGPTFTKVLQTQLDREMLMKSGRQGATRLIPKVDGVPDVTELRPITLLQVDYRLLSKCLAVRLHLVMEEVVEPGQLGTAGRNILTGFWHPGTT